VCLCLKRIGFTVAEIDEELPCGEPGHRRCCSVHVVDTRRLMCQIRCRCGDVLGIGSTVSVAGEPQHAEDFIADREALHTLTDPVDDTRHIRPRNGRQRDRRPQLGRKLLTFIPVAQIPVGGVEAHGVNANEDLTVLELGDGHCVVTQYLRAAEFVQPNRFHLGRHRSLLSVPTRERRGTDPPDVPFYRNTMLL